MAILIQTEKIDDKNTGELFTLEFLSRLPDDYIIIRELKISKEIKQRNPEQKQPDFVVLSPKTGILIFEVKDWNLNKNIYTAKDQYHYICENKTTGSKKEVRNPYDQINDYRYTIADILKKEKVKCKMEAYAVFARNTRNEFKLSIGSSSNGINNIFLFDEVHTLFSDDMNNYYSNPEIIVNRLILQSNQNIPLPDKETVHAIKNILIPDYFRIGDNALRMKQREEMTLLSEKQKNWVFSSNKNENFLFDVAGSGKTNCLISKAMHLCDKAENIKILLTTYNEHLKSNLQDIIKKKSIDYNQQKAYDSSISVLTLKEIYQLIVEGVFPREDFDSLSDKDQKDMVIQQLRLLKDKAKIFDYALIDEIQDFDTDDIRIIQSLLKANNFFFVGDIGQKLLDKVFDLKKLGLLVSAISLPKSYKMYRTPAKIAKLAYKFIQADIQVREEFIKNGYESDQISFNNNYPSKTEFTQTGNHGVALKNQICTLFDQGYLSKDIMIICHESLMDKISQVMISNQLSFSLNEYSDEKIIVTEFTKSKGLERPVIIIIGIEYLEDKNSSSMILKSYDEKMKIDQLSRRKIYVALTRATERVIIYYEYTSNTLITELIRLNEII